MKETNKQVTGIGMRRMWNKKEGSGISKKEKRKKERKSYWNKYRNDVE